MNNITIKIFLLPLIMVVFSFPSKGGEDLDYQQTSKMINLMKQDSFTIKEDYFARKFKQSFTFRGYYSFYQAFSPLAPNVDESGLPLHRTLKTYTIVSLSQRALKLIESYHLYDDPVKKQWALDNAVKIAKKLKELSVSYRGSLLSQESFFHKRGGVSFEPPWSSGMGQGQMLDVFSRLYQITEEKQYLDWAGQTFNAFFLLKRDNPNNMWISTIDPNGYLWIEEYPTNKPSHTINGFIFAIYGIAEYFIISKDVRAKKLLDASLTTIKDNILLIRNPGDISFKDINFKDIKPRKYNITHMEQLTLLSMMTGDGYFYKVAKIFHDDMEQYDTLINEVVKMNDNYNQVVTYLEGVINNDVFNYDDYSFTHAISNSYNKQIFKK